MWKLHSQEVPFYFISMWAQEGNHVLRFLLFHCAPKDAKDHFQHGHQQFRKGGWPRWPRWPMAPGSARLAQCLRGQGSPSWDVSSLARLKTLAVCWLFPRLELVDHAFWKSVYRAVEFIKAWDRSASQMRSVTMLPSALVRRVGNGNGSLGNGTRLEIPWNCELPSGNLT